MSTSGEDAGWPSERSHPRPRQVKDEVHGPNLASQMDPSKPASPPAGHQNFVFPDPVVFKYLEEDPVVTVLERRRRLQGYEIHLVEQWACSRVDPTFVIATYTGDSSHSILVGVLSVPIEETTWSSRLKVYFRAISEYHTREETPLGTLMVTNLSWFPSSLTVISVPDGDIRKHREDFIVNENLKRLGCAGRAGLTLQQPQPSTTAKFHYLYRVSESVPLYTSVMELVKLCQVSLSLYGKLEPAFADGLLCDITENSIGEWWSDIGMYMYNIEPNDGILGPSTVSALVGLLMGAFNRMKAYGAPVGKDVFEVESTKRAIGYFQKTQRIERSRRLDRQTLMKLHKVTAKAASGEGWNVPKAVKSTVAELSGKGGEMVMGIVGGRDKAGIAEVETLDIERLAQLVIGTKARWLWQGKAARSNEADTSRRLNPSESDKVFSTDAHGNYLWTGKHRDSLWSDSKLRRGDHTDDPDSKTGFGRFKGAVGLPGLRTHPPRQHKDDSRPNPAHAQNTHEQHDDQDSKLASAEQKSKKQVKTLFPALDKSAMEATTLDLVAPAEQKTSENTVPKDASSSVQGSNLGEQSRHRLKDDVIGDLSQKSYSSIFNDSRTGELQLPALKRARSSSRTMSIQTQSQSINRVPRYLSFSAIESVILKYDFTGKSFADQVIEGQNPYQAMLAEEANSAFVNEKGEKIHFLEEVTIPFTERQVSKIDDLQQLSQSHQDELNGLYYERLNEYHTQRATLSDVMADERQDLNEGLRRLDMLGAKLDYELNALNSRIEEVQDGVTDFERAVVHIEARVDKLTEDEGERESCWWDVRRFFRTGKS